MTQTTVKTITYSMQKEELEQAVVFYLRHQNAAARKLMDEEDHCLEVDFRVRAGDYDPLTGQPRAIVKGVDIEIQIEED